MRASTAASTGEGGGAAEEEGCLGEVGVEFGVAGGKAEGFGGHRLCGCDGGEVGLQGSSVSAGVWSRSATAAVASQR